MLLDLLRRAQKPLMIREIAEGIHVSRPTAAKYVDICEAARLVKSEWYATARQVSLVHGRGGQGARKGEGA